ncbi:Anoctamin-7 [Rhizophlyctis rosea]|uniref:Anoctamin-7 n=1 Tax=Rhizophlyctis rosea TaxID=64517 RepID=A0AAD5X3S6_9FUNG|nr:Anoctamin-7 [Rhizophlyctis rosea]
MTIKPEKQLKSPSATGPRIRSTRAFSLSLSPSQQQFSPNALPVPSTDQIVIDRIDNRDILLLHDRDVQLFDEIMQFRRQGRGLGDALDEFCPQSADALVKIAYADASTHWDCVLVYTLGDQKQDHIRLSFLHALLWEGLIIEREVAPDGVNVFVKVLAPFDRLCMEAEREKLQVPLQERQASHKLRNLTPTNADQVWNGVVNILKSESTSEKHSATFRKDHLARFVGGNVAALGLREVQARFFSSAQRSLLTYHIIMRARMKTLGKKYARRGDHARYIERLLSDGVFTDLFPLHDGPTTKSHTNLRSQMYNTRRFGICPVKLNDMRSYYGEKIAMYFGWLEHYTRWLGFASIAGILVFGYGIYAAYLFALDDKLFADIGRDNLTENLEDAQSAAGRIFDNWATMPFAFVISVWLLIDSYPFPALLYVEFWSRRNKALAWDWDVMRYEKQERTRPKWYATTVRTSHVTHRIEPHFPRRAQRWIIMMTSVVYLIALNFVVATVGAFIVYNAWVQWYFGNFFSEWQSYAGITSALLSLVTITLTTPVTYGLSKWLTDLENHKTETQYQDARIAKMMLYDFVNNFGSLFYVSVVKIWLQKSKMTILGQEGWDDTCTSGNCVLELSIQLAIVFIGKSCLQHAYHWGLPWLDRKRTSLATKLSKPTQMHHTPVFAAEQPTAMQFADIESSRGTRRSSVSPIKVMTVPQAVHDIKLVPFNAQAGMNDGYNVAVIQFGFVVLFSVAFPLAPLFACIHNAVQLRIDAHNLLTQYRRPFALQAQDIGMWEVWLRTVAHLGIFMNACIIAFSSSFFEQHYLDRLGTDKWVQWAARLAFIMIFEHLVLGIKLLVGWMIPDVPPKVRRALERQEYVDKVLRGEENEDEGEEDIHPDDLKGNGCIIL